jgi:hypothetical protein
VLKVRDSNRGRNEFVAVIYGEFDRPSANVYVDKRRMLLTIDYQQMAAASEWAYVCIIIGDQNIHAGTAQMILQPHRIATGWRWRAPLVSLSSRGSAQGARSWSQPSYLRYLSCTYRYAAGSTGHAGPPPALRA